NVSLNVLRKSFSASPANGYAGPRQNMSHRAKDQSLSQQPSMIAVGSADLTNSPTHIAGARPDVVLLDVGAAGGFDIVLALRRILPDLKVIAIAINGAEAGVCRASYPATARSRILGCTRLGRTRCLLRDRERRRLLPLKAHSAGSPPRD